MENWISSEEMKEHLDIFFTKEKCKEWKMSYLGAFVKKRRARKFLVAQWKNNYTRNRKTWNRWKTFSLIYSPKRHLLRLESIVDSRPDKPDWGGWCCFVSGLIRELVRKINGSFIMGGIGVSTTFRKGIWFLSWEYEDENKYNEEIKKLNIRVKTVRLLKKLGPLSQ